MIYDKIGTLYLHTTLEYENQKNEAVLENLETINLIVGPNNSGKSRLLRSIFKSDKLHYRPAGFNWAGLQAKLLEVHTRVTQVLQRPIVGYGSLNADTFGSWANRSWMDAVRPDWRTLRDLVANLVNNENFNPRTQGGMGSADQARALHQEMLPLFHELSELIKENEFLDSENPRCYIPILRGLRAVQEINPVNLSNGNFLDCYAERTCRDYKIESNSTRQVFTGLRMYDNLKSLSLGSRALRQRVVDYQHFLSRTLFEGRAIELTPLEGSDVIHVNLDGDDERPIHELGDGIQAIIILTFHAFTADAPTLFFIEEPETNLHPGMQRKLLEVFSNERLLNRHQYFMTTHSNHMLDMAADYGKCATYLVRKDTKQTPQFRVSNVSAKDRSILEALGARASSVFLTNATIWVEGVTDRRYLREYLRKYLATKYSKTTISEDTHYSFMEAGGSCVVHFDFAEANEAEPVNASTNAPINIANICSRSFLVLDGDNENKGRVPKLREALGRNLFVTKGKEIENLLPLPVLVAYVERRTRESCTDRLTTDYQNLLEPLGKWLDEKLKCEIFTDGQTIKNKDGLCTFSVEYMREKKDWALCPDAADLCDALVQFIAHANGITLESESGS